MDVTFGSRALFPELEARAYHNHASIAPPSRRVVDAVTEWMRLYARLGLGAYEPAAEQRVRLKGMLATLLGCASSDLAFTSATSHGLILIASSIPLEPNDRILCFRGEFPANVTPWQQAAAVAGGRVEFIEQENRSDAELLADVEQALVGGKVRLITASAVQFATGRVMPIAQLASLAHAHGAEIAVDGIQALGVMPMNVRELGVDYLAGGSHKWLMGIEGTGFLYVAPERLAGLRRTQTSWLSHEDSLAFLMEGAGELRYDRPFRSDASFLEGHSLSAMGCVALEAGLAPILELGVDAVQAHVRSLNDALEVGLVARGFRSLRLPGSASGTLSVCPPEGSDPVMWAERLGAEGVVLSIPDGKLRFSPHWPNDRSEVEVVLDAVDRIGA